MCEVDISLHINSLKAICFNHKHHLKQKNKKKEKLYKTVMLEISEAEVENAACYLLMSLVKVTRGRVWGMEEGSRREVVMITILRRRRSCVVV